MRTQRSLATNLLYRFRSFLNQYLRTRTNIIIEDLCGHLLQLESARALPPRRSKRGTYGDDLLPPSSIKSFLRGECDPRSALVNQSRIKYCFCLVYLNPNPGSELAEQLAFSSLRVATPTYKSQGRSNGSAQETKGVGTYPPRPVPEACWGRSRLQQRSSSGLG